MRRVEKRLKKASDKHHKDEVAHNSIKDIHHWNSDVEHELKAKKESGYVADASVKDFLDLKPASKLKIFIHARTFDGPIF